MKIAFAGTPDFAAQHLKGLLNQGVTISLVISQPDKPGKRGKKLVPSPVKVLATEKGIPLIQPEKFVASDLEPHSIDLLVVVAYGQILRQSLLDTPTHGCINVHGSLLPRWRGAAPIQRAIEAGDSETGVCIMQMDAGLDTGPVFLERKTAIDPAETSADLSARLVDLGVAGLIQVFEQIENQSSTPQPQIEGGATYAKKIDKAEAAIDWTESAQTLRAKIHALNPDPVCYCQLTHEDKPLRVKIHHVDNILPCKGISPGQVISVQPEGVLVATGQDALLIDKLQLPIGKGSVLTGRDILNSRADIVHSGVIFT